MRFISAVMALSKNVLKSHRERTQDQRTALEICEGNWKISSRKETDAERGANSERGKTHDTSTL